MQDKHTREQKKKQEYLASCIRLDQIFTNSTRNAVPYIYPKDNKKLDVFIGNQHNIYFAYLHKIIDPQDGGLRFIRFFLEAGKLYAEYSTRNFKNIYLKNMKKKKIFKEVIAENVEDFTLKYACREKLGDQVIWYDTWLEKEKIPVGILYMISFKNSDEIYRCFRRTTGNSQFMAYESPKEQNKDDEHEL